MINENQEMKDINMENSTIEPVEETKSEFNNPFSFRGVSGRLNYLGYGVLAPYVILGFGFSISIQLESFIAFYISLILALAIGLTATVRRARDRKENIVLLMILSMIPYVNILIMLYLLLAPSKKEGEIVKTSKVALWVMGIMALLIFIAILIPKFATAY